MRISELTLTSFRNYPERTFSFDSDLTLVLGPNGSGKTNILEAIYLLATGESWRGETTEEMIGFGEEVGHVLGNTEQATSDKPSPRAQVFDSETQAFVPRTQPRGTRGAEGRQATSIQKSNLGITLTRGFLHGKRVAKVKYKVDGVAKRKSDFVGRLKVVLFEPQSLMIVIGDPSYRRAFLDDALSQTDVEYRNDLHVYARALKVRNRLLDAIREGKAQRESLEYWERAMVKHGERIQERRREMVEWFNGQIVSKGQTSKGQTFKGLTFFGLELGYDASPISDERLEQYREREIAAGFSLIGPQRDDLQIVSKDEERRMKDEGKPLAQFGSRGEQRMAVLRLKLAEAQWIEEKTGESPVLLLDDIYSELDDEHDQMVGEFVRGRQTIITATKMPQRFSGAETIIKLTS